MCESNTALSRGWGLSSQNFLTTRVIFECRQVVILLCYGNNEVVKRHFDFTPKNRNQRTNSFFRISISEGTWRCMRIKRCSTSTTAPRCPSASLNPLDRSSHKVTSWVRNGSNMTWRPRMDILGEELSVRKEKDCQSPSPLNKWVLRPNSMFRYGRRIFQSTSPGR